MAAEDVDARPSLPPASALPQPLQPVRTLCSECWLRNPKRRPTLAEVEDRLRGVAAAAAEAAAEERTVADSLLDDMLPRHVTAALAAGLRVEPEPFDDVTARDSFSFSSNPA